MNRIFAGALCLVIAGSSVRADDKGPGTSEYYPTKIGTEWHYKVGDGAIVNKLTKHEKIGDQVCARLDSYNRGMVVANEHVAVTKDGVVRTATLGFQPDPPLLILKANAKKGDEWKVDSVVAKETMKGKAVVDEEEVTVPAGKYKAIKIIMTVESGGNKIVTTNWYAKGVGMVKQHLVIGQAVNVTLELEKFVSDQ